MCCITLINRLLSTPNDKFKFTNNVQTTEKPSQRLFSNASTQPLERGPITDLADLKLDRLERGKKNCIFDRSDVCFSRVTSLRVTVRYGDDVFSARTINTRGLSWRWKK